MGRIPGVVDGLGEDLFPSCCLGGRCVGLLMSPSRRGLGRMMSLLSQYWWASRNSGTGEDMVTPHQNGGVGTHPIQKQVI
ncbi:hypothetical protein CEXT_653611 [Caerostris extrusa]|uniref:Uncharacterized protein n=1 Tax=Caerostris extrusa TaxID=172846 RepID=A0AAV4NBJ6_CAEEX|nr:hypothetical protein CEXT_653611 [Caerostris extrusa]